MAGALRIGTSGWHYDSWWGPLFPEGLRKKDALKFYSGAFFCTELNARAVLSHAEPRCRSSWVEQTPDDFRFAWKASRFITHWKRLSEKSESSLALMDARLEELGAKLGPVLFQLPPAMKANVESLASIMGMLRCERHYAFEFRHASWYEPKVLALLREHDCSLCLLDHADAPSPWEETASFVYIRGHGPGGRYAGSYSDDALSQWAGPIREWRGQGKNVWCFFENDIKSATPADARRLSDLFR